MRGALGQQKIDDCQLLGGAGLKHRLIRGAGQTFFRGSMGVKAKFAQSYANEFRQVLVELGLQRKLTQVLG